MDGFDKSTTSIPLPQFRWHFLVFTIWNQHGKIDHDFWQGEKSQLKIRQNINNDMWMKSWIKIVLLGQLINEVPMNIN